MNRRAAFWISIAAGIIASVVSFGLYAFHQWEFTAAETHVEAIGWSVKEFAQDHKRYPENLTTLRAENHLDEHLFDFPPGISLVYLRPNLEAPDNVPILVLTSQRNKYVVYKDLSRRFNPCRSYAP